MPEFERRQIRIQSDHLVSPARPDRAVPKLARATNPLMAQQQALGNQAVQHSLHAGMIQPKLRVDQPAGKYEREGAVTPEVCTDKNLHDAILEWIIPHATERIIENYSPRELGDVKILTAVGGFVGASSGTQAPPCWPWRNP